MTGPGGIIFAIINIIAFIAGAAAIIIIIISAIRFITSSGDSSKVEKARATIINALIGLAVIVLGTALIDFVLSKL